MRNLIVTLSQQTIAGRTGGYRQVVKEWQATDDDRVTWAYRFANRPKVDVGQIEYVFFLVGGRVRYLSMPLYFFEPQLYPGQEWLNLTHFERLPRECQLRMRGFRGFRYTTEEQDEVLLNF